MNNTISFKADKVYIFPLDRFYLAGDSGHCWSKTISENKLIIGFDSIGAAAAGEIKYVRTRQVGKQLKQLKPLGTLESGKWIGPLLIPFSGTITKINEKVIENPSLINEDPFKHWIVEIEVEKDLYDEEQNHDLIINIGNKEKLEKYIQSEIERFELK